MLVDKEHKFAHIQQQKTCFPRTAKLIDFWHKNSLGQFPIQSKQSWKYNCRKYGQPVVKVILLFQFLKNILVVKVVRIKFICSSFS